MGGPIHWATGLLRKARSSGKKLGGLVAAWPSDWSTKCSSSICLVPCGPRDEDLGASSGRGAALVGSPVLCERLRQTAARGGASPVAAAHDRLGPRCTRARSGFPPADASLGGLPPAGGREGRNWRAPRQRPCSHL